MERTKEWVRQANIEHLRRRLSEASSAEDRATLERLLTEELEAGPGSGGLATMEAGAPSPASAPEVRDETDI